MRPRRPPARPPRRLPAALPAGVLAALLAGAVLSALGAAAAELPPPVYQLTMFARFDDATGVIHGSERLRWQNTSSVEIGELRFHLYLNAFANSRSTFMRESGGRLRWRHASTASAGATSRSNRSGSAVAPTSSRARSSSPPTTATPTTARWPATRSPSRSSPAVG